jgi:predicted  nucleic acid-binding Zn-ribbon protein
MNLKRALLLCLFATLLLCFFSADKARAQTAKQSDDNSTLQQLLNEVSLLRKTLQRTGLSAYRSQIILERMRAHNEQVVRLTRMLEDVRDEMEKIETTIPRTIEQVKLIENMIEQETDASKRVQWEVELKEVKRSTDQYKARLERQREREQQLTTLLHAEQTKLSEMESRLDALEREIENEIERQRTEDTSPESKKRP